MPLYSTVDHSEDARLDPYRDIRERDLVGREGRFIAEGEVVLTVLERASRFAVASCLIAENRIEPLRPLLDRLPAECPVFVASRAIIERIAGFDIHRGVLAIGERPAPFELDAFLASLPRRAILVVAIGIANHDNIGGIFRNAAAFGADAVLMGPWQLRSTLQKGDPSFGRRRLHSAVSPRAPIERDRSFRAGARPARLRARGVEPYRGGAALRLQASRPCRALCRRGGAGPSGGHSQRLPRPRHTHGAWLRFTQRGRQHRHRAPSFTAPCLTAAGPSCSKPATS